MDWVSKAAEAHSLKPWEFRAGRIGASSRVNAFLGQDHKFFLSKNVETAIVSVLCPDFSEEMPKGNLTEIIMCNFNFKLDNSGLYVCDSILDNCEYDSRELHLTFPEIFYQVYDKSGVLFEAARKYSSLFEAGKKERFTL